MRWVLACLLLGLVCAPPAARAATAPVVPGQTTSGSTVSHGAEYRYRLYTPTSYRPGVELPLVVMAHGCQTTAEQHERSTLAGDVAEREGFAVLYVDVDAAGRALPGPLNQCWKFFDPAAYGRDGSDTGAFADMTRDVLAAMTIDRERVYLVGTSAGGLIAAVASVAYPELYAAGGLVVSAGFMDAPCFASGVGVPVELSAQLAREAMGTGGRVVPRIAIGSDGDLAFPASCTEKALEQSLRTTNLVLSGTQTAPVALSPAAVREHQVPGGLRSTVSTYHDPAGCVIGERWIVHGMPHAWPGGTTDPKFAGFTDPRGPNGVEAVWAFLERYRRSDTAMPCAEAPARVTRARSCPARDITVRLGRPVRRVVASVDGRRVRARVRGRRVVVRMPAGEEGMVRVRLELRRAAGSRTVERSFARCG